LVSISHCPFFFFLLFSSFHFLYFLPVWRFSDFSFLSSVAVADLCYDIEEYTIEQRLVDRFEARGGKYEGMDSLLYCPRWNISSNTAHWTREVYNDTVLLLSQTTDPDEIQMYEDLLVELNDTLDNIEYAWRCDWILNVFDQTSKDMCGKQL
jgi:hypothetical protein